MSDVSQAEYRELERMVNAAEHENAALTKKNNALLSDLAVMRERAEIAERELAVLQARRCEICWLNQEVAE